jgi:hypothetical protein
MFRSVVAAAVAAALSTAGLAGSAQARITEIKIDTIEPFADGQPFGEAGSYERVTGIARGELDPQSPQNQPIADLDKAPRNARGLVEYETDFFILRPLDPSRGNGVIFYEVNNRGRKELLSRVDEAPAGNNDPRTILDAGLGFSLGQARLSGRYPRYVEGSADRPRPGKRRANRNSGQRLELRDQPGGAPSAPRQEVRADRDL